MTIDDKPLCRKPLTLTTTLTLPPGFMFVGVVKGTTTGSRERNEGLEADVGVFEQTS
jgi:hypothetical protein